MVHERRLHVELGELELPVGPQVLVAQATGDLVVAVDAGHHEQLFGQLRALGEHVTGTRAQPAGDSELTGPLRGGRPQQGRLHLYEPLPVHGRPQCSVDSGPQAKIGLHPRPSQVDVTEPETGGLVHLDPVVNGKGRWLGRVEHDNGAIAHLDLAGGQFGVLLPSGRRRTVPLTAITNSLRTSTVPGITHWMMPV